MIVWMLMPLLTIQGPFPPTRKAKPSPSHFWHDLKTAATAEQVWAVWTDVSQWHTWDSGLKEASAKADLALGVHGTITSLEGRDTEFEIVEWAPLKAYTFRTKLPLGALFVRRSLVETETGVTFTHEVWFQGLSKGLFGRMLGPGFRDMLPGVMDAVARQAQNR